MNRKLGLMTEDIPEAVMMSSWSSYDEDVNRLIPGAVRITNKAWGENSSQARQLWASVYGEENPGIDCFFHLAMDYLASLKGLREISPRRLKLAEEIFERKFYFRGERV